MSKNAVCYTVILICLLTAACLAKYSGGNGTAEAPYLIATPNDLNAIGTDSNDWDKHFKMIADINLAQYSGETFNRIGNSQREFKGTFDGNEHIITNFNWTKAPSYDSGIGVFGLVGHECHIRNVILECVDINALPYSDDVGALVGYNYGGLISHCSTSGRICGNGSVGGLVGYNNKGTILNCYSSIIISGDYMCVGGLIGFDREGSITDCTANATVLGNYAVGGLLGEALASNVCKCYSTSDVNGTGLFIGGLIGYIISSSVVDCYSSGMVLGNKDVGGLVGYSWYISGSQAPVANCYSITQVEGNENVGSLIGRLSDPSENCINSFWDVSVNPDANGIGNGSDPNVIGLPTAEMQRRSTFADAGWDMVNIWDIGEGQTYPFLRTHLPSDINKDDETNFLDLAILTENWLGEK